jgi:hypothetical protein
LRPQEALPGMRTWRERPKEKERCQGVRSSLAMRLIRFRLIVASSSDCPPADNRPTRHTSQQDTYCEVRAHACPHDVPDRNMTPGTAGGTRRRSTSRVRLAVSSGDGRRSLGQSTPAMIIWGFRSVLQPSTPPLRPHLHHISLTPALTPRGRHRTAPGRSTPAPPTPQPARPHHVDSRNTK